MIILRQKDFTKARTHNNIGKKVPGGIVDANDNACLDNETKVIIANMKDQEEIYNSPKIDPDMQVAAHAYWLETHK